ncbi:class I SAM-dependent methyltransferase [Brevundimonas sp. NPDC092305]|uniref:class I SAM-dependent methyltransferase n=1 Tax=Brevundimonas sp. NPDC092305 TaxID=3363957 RepID=UPI00380FDCB0
MTTEQINSPSYWEKRFATGDWQTHRGSWQTTEFAKAQVKRFGIPADFDGTIVDFGCATGDAFPVYREAYPKAKLVGVDISNSATDEARRKYGEFATFIAGGVEAVPASDVIIASNVLEHLDDDLAIATELRLKSQRLFIVVPYREAPLDLEHVRSYEADRFDSLGPKRHVIYYCVGWTEFGRGLIRKAVKNVGRIFRAQPVYPVNRQIMFEF